jgi:hypothetical protein
MQEETKQEDTKEAHDSVEKAAVTLPGTVEKIIPPISPAEPEKAQIAVEGADHLYREIRVENVLKDADGNEVALKVGAEVDVTIEADPEATKPAKKSSSHLDPERRRTPRNN